MHRVSQELVLRELQQPELEPTAFAFPLADRWGYFTVLVASASGAVHAVAPLAPFHGRCPTAVVQRLMAAETTSESSRAVRSLFDIASDLTLVRFQPRVGALLGVDRGFPTTHSALVCCVANSDTVVCAVAGRGVRRRGDPARGGDGGGAAVPAARAQPGAAAGGRLGRRRRRG
jgi:hypothetical protein